jgi:hypothetical protein
MTFKAKWGPPSAHFGSQKADEGPCTTVAFLKSDSAMVG